MRVLVVDDELPIMQLCVKVLEDAGHVVEGFSRGESLLARLGAEPADLLVVDYRMPGPNGVQVVRRARALRPEIPVVMITGHGTPEVLAEAHAAGVTGVLLKPFAPAALVEAVRRALGATSNMGGPDMARPPYGGPRMAPQSPQGSGRPGEAVTPLESPTRFVP